MPEPELHIQVPADDGRIVFVVENPGDNRVKVRFEAPTGALEVVFTAEQTANLVHSVRSIERAAFLAGIAADPAPSDI